jgi:hypothetical protein
MNIPYHLSRVQGQIRRKMFGATLARHPIRPLEQCRRIDAVVYTMSCERDLPEQVASIYSLFTHVGIPDSFVIASDGSYTNESIKTLESIHECIQVKQLDELVSRNLPKCIADYANVHLFGRKLALIFSIPVEKCTVWIDSDILFFQRGDELASLCNTDDSNVYYLPDNEAWIDPSMLREGEEGMSPINAGFFILKRQLNWTESLRRLEALAGKYHTYTEQTSVQIAMYQSGAQALDPSLFVLQTDDRFIYSDLYSKSPIALRHYVGPVRHKFWNALRQGIS